MSRDWKLIFFIVASVALVIVGLVFGISSLSLLSGPDMCGNEILHEHAAPGGRLKVVVFQRDCGATTGFSTQASILRVGEGLPNESGNLFAADTDHGAAPSGPGGGPELRVEWRGARELQLSHHAKARLFEAKKRAKGVSVGYSKFQ